MATLITRRTSLQTLSLTMGGLLTQPAGLLGEQQPKPKKMGIALVGLGNLGQTHQSC